MRLKRLPPGTYMLLEDPNALRGWLAIRRLSYADLARMTGVSKAFIGKLCSGDKRSCSPELAQRIEQILLPPPEQRTPREPNLFVPKGTVIPTLPAALTPPRPARRTDYERFIRYVDRKGPDECWPWLGAKTGDGYGSFHAGGKHTFAHRFSYTAFVRPIPTGLTIDHVAAKGCTRKDCVNPAHLEAVTHQENCRRAWAARRARMNSDLDVDESPISSEGGERVTA